MGPYGSDSTTVGSTACSGPEMDAILAGTGYGLSTSGPCHVANPDYSIPFNPSDVTTWVDSMLTDFNSASTGNLHLQPIPATWTDQICSPLNPTDRSPSHVLIAQQRKEEEDSGIRLVHLLMTCADAVQHGSTGLAAGMVDEMRVLLSRVNTLSGIGKVAGYFADALFRRLYTTETPLSVTDHEVLYHHFYEACPYLKFAHFTANQAILEAFEGYDRVHVIDFSLMQGLQWPALIQALALRPGGPPFLRITGIGPPSPDGRDALREVGFKLAELARSVRVRFAFRGVAANRLDDVKPWMLQATHGEAIAVNSVLQLHRLLTDPGTTPAPVDSVLEWIVGIRPKVVTVVEQEADHNKPTFIDRFTEALFYYSTMFDSLEGSRPHHQRQMALAEVYLQKEICNIVCCEGENRVERHEPLTQWRTRLTNAGLNPVHLGSGAFRQASMLLTLFSDEGYCVEEVDGCLTLGWHNRALISASAWRVPDADVSPDDDSSVIASNSNNCINSNNNISGSDDNNRISM